MINKYFFVFLVGIVILCAGCAEQPQETGKTDEVHDADSDTAEVDTPEMKPMFYDTSLHATTGGMKKIYDEGFRHIAGKEYYELDCYDCHATCDDCHAKEVNGNRVYDTAVAKDQMTCLKCHAREGIITNMNVQDVHSANNLTCMDCHTEKEVHGMGVEYDTMKNPDILETECEGCHYRGSDKASPPSETSPHTIHGDRIDCLACHVGTSISCYNCHFDTYLEYHQKIPFPTKDWLFLINYDGKVSSANIMTLSYGTKTHAIFTPQFPHNIINPGRVCGDCHGNENIMDIAQDNAITLTWWDEGFKHKTGVIPVMDTETYEYGLQFLWLDYNPDTQEKKWSSLENQEDPNIIIGNYGKPLTSEQLEKLKLKVS